jgi:hypothetical protein
MDQFRGAVKEILPALPPRLHFIQDKSVREWILASDVVVSSYSTSLIEAAVAEKSVYMLEPYPIPESLHVGWHDLVPHIKTYDEFLAQDTMKVESDALLGEWARKTLMADGDPIHRMANFIAQLVQGKMELPSSPSWKTIVPANRYRAYIQLRKIYRKVRFLLGIPKIEPVPQEYLKDIQGPEEINSRIRRWSDVLYAPPQK